MTLYVVVKHPTVRSIIGIFSTEKKATEVANLYRGFYQSNSSLIVVDILELKNPIDHIQPGLLITEEDFTAFPNNPVSKYVDLSFEIWGKVWPDDFDVQAITKAFLYCETPEKEEAAS